MRIGLQIPHFRPSTPETMRGWLKRTVQAVDSGGFDSLWVMDHFFQLGAWLGRVFHPWFLRRVDGEGENWFARWGCDLPPPGSSGQDGVNAGRSLRRSNVLRHWSGMV